MERRAVTPVALQKS